jgi:hypothetical protein
MFKNDKYKAEPFGLAPMVVLLRSCGPNIKAGTMGSEKLDPILQILRQNQREQVFWYQI